MRYLMMSQEVWDIVSEHQLIDKLQQNRTGIDLGFEIESVVDVSFWN